jgi:hypothetical protein
MTPSQSPSWTLSRWIKKRRLLLHPAACGIEPRCSPFDIASSLHPPVGAASRMPLSPQITLDLIESQEFFMDLTSYPEKF